MDASSWFTQTCTMQVPNGFAASGSRERTWGTATTLMARVTPQDERIEAADGTATQSSHLLRTDKPVPVNARIWIPGTDPAVSAQARRVLRVRQTTQKDGKYTLYRVDLG